jgi:hypothetical protein
MGLPDLVCFSEDGSCFLAEFIFSIECNGNVVSVAYWPQNEFIALNRNAIFGEGVKAVAVVVQDLTNVAEIASDSAIGIFAYLSCVAMDMAAQPFSICIK